MNAVSSVKKFVANNKTTIIVAAVALTAIAVMQKGLNQHNDFLKKHDLFDEFISGE